ncbi:hypothetical protein BJ170DRAFT_677617 [Xylariales sp. AK1849]|nr:hypothetical protein BJ170DRAFT_677617 [Xylariales sp. AK1849]
MVLHLVSGLDLVNILDLLDKSHDILGNLARGERIHEFSSFDEYRSAQTGIFRTLRAYVDVDICNLIVLNFPNLLGCGKHIKLLNDWNLKYPFTTKGEPGESNGIPLWLVHAAKPKHRGFAGTQPSTRNFQRQPGAANHQQQGSNTEGLFYSPTTMQPPHVRQTETYLDTDHGRELRRPSPLVRRHAQSPVLTTAVLNSPTKQTMRRYHLDETTLNATAGVLFTSIIEPRARASVTEAPAGIRQAVTWPSLEADHFNRNFAHKPGAQIGAVDFLARCASVLGGRNVPRALCYNWELLKFDSLLEDNLDQLLDDLMDLEGASEIGDELDDEPDDELDNELNNELDYELENACETCRAIRKANLRMVYARIVPSWHPLANSQAEIRQRTIENLRKVGYEQTQPAALVAVLLSQLSFEEQIRNVQLQLDLIINKPDQQQENLRVTSGGRRVGPLFGPLRDITNISSYESDEGIEDNHTTNVTAGAVLRATTTRALGGRMLSALRFPTHRVWLPRT